MSWPQAAPPDPEGGARVRQPTQPLEDRRRPCTAPTAAASWRFPDGETRLALGHVTRGAPMTERTYCPEPHQYGTEGTSWRGPNCRYMEKTHEHDAVPRCGALGIGDEDHHARRPHDGQRF